MLDRRKIRTNLLKIRHQYDPHLQNLASLKIASKIFNTSLFQQSHNIACYLAAKGEVNVVPLIQKIWELQKICYLPLLDPRESRRLHFMAYNEYDQLQKNKYNILQPFYDESKIIMPQELDLVIVPLVGFDVGGNRIGQGGGYYDYTLREQKPEPKPYLLGIAYEWQKISDITAFSWDVKLDAVVTDEAWYVFK